MPDKNSQKLVNSHFTTLYNGPMHYFTSRNYYLVFKTSSKFILLTPLWLYCIFRHGTMAIPWYFGLISWKHHVLWTFTMVKPCKYLKNTMICQYCQYYTKVCIKAPNTACNISSDKSWPFALSPFTICATSRTWHQYLSTCIFVFSERGVMEGRIIDLRRGSRDETHRAVGSFVSWWRSQTLRWLFSGFKALVSRLKTAVQVFSWSAGDEVKMCCFYQSDESIRNGKTTCVLYF